MFLSTFKNFNILIICSLRKCFYQHFKTATFCSIVPIEYVQEENWSLANIIELIIARVEIEHWGQCVVCCSVHIVLVCN